VATQNLHVLCEVIKRNYQSLERPDYSFVSKAISSKPNDLLIKKVQDLFDVEELTDTNDDVSFHYLVSKSNNQWIIELSMLGLYATVLKILKDGHAELVASNTTIPEEKDILSLLLGSQYEVLEQDELEQSIALKLFNTEPENTCVYQALFSDTDVLPWKA